MKKSFLKKLNITKKAIRGNRGSGVITVIIAMMFLFSLASSLIVMTYSGFTMKTSQRAGNQVSVDASTAMDQIRVGLQNVVSDCMKVAYNDALIDYSYSSLGIQQKFATSYVEALYSYQVLLDDGTTISLFTDNNTKYNTKALKQIVDTASGSDFQMNNTTGDVTETMDVSENKLEGKIVLKNVSITARKGKNISTITADIAIGVPNIGAKLSQLSMAGVPEFAVIAGGKIQHKSNNPVTITGCVYGNELDLGMLTTMYIDGKVAMFKGDASVEGTFDSRPRLETSADTTFWANTIRVHAVSWAKMMGSTLVANDLDLFGFEAKATLGGMYYGFGADTSDATKSSAILANGRDSVLDLTDLDNLTLSGLAFIKDDAKKTSDYTPQNVLMGESVSVKDNQRLYLVPVKDLQYREIEDKRPTGEYLPMKSNPEVFSSASGFTSVKVTLKDRVLWSVDGHEYKYSSYGAKVQTMGQPYGTNQSVAYYFLKFSSANGRTATENANLYFRHFFMNNIKEISSYISNYITVIDDPYSPVNAKTAGNSFTSETEYDETTGKDLISYEIRTALNSVSVDTVNLESSMYSTMYSAACTSLKYDVYEPEHNPFNYYINDDADGYFKTTVSPNNNIKYYDKQIMFVNGDITVDSNSNPDNQQVPNTVVMLIATGNVTLQRDFSGCIMCGGDLIIENGNLTADMTSYQGCYQWLMEQKVNVVNSTTHATEEKSLGELYFRNSPIQEKSWADAGSKAKLTDLVTFENWFKE